MNSIVGVIVGFITAALSVFGFGHPNAVPTSIQDRKLQIVDQTVPTLKTSSRTPIIVSVSPTSGTVGTQITLTGSGFTSTGNRIHFGKGCIENVSSENENRIIFSVPMTVDSCHDPRSADTDAQPETIVPGVPYGLSIYNSHGYSNDVVFTTNDENANISVPGMSEYTNAKYGFSFQYPSNLELHEGIVSTVTPFASVANIAYDQDHSEGYLTVNASSDSSDFARVCGSADSNQSTWFVSPISNIKGVEMESKLNHSGGSFGCEKDYTRVYGGVCYDIEITSQADNSVSNPLVVGPCESDKEQATLLEKLDSIAQSIVTSFIFSNESAQ